MNLSIMPSSSALPVASPSQTVLQDKKAQAKLVNEAASVLQKYIRRYNTTNRVYLSEKIFQFLSARNEKFSKEVITAICKDVLGVTLDPNMLGKSYRRKFQESKDHLIGWPDASSPISKESDPIGVLIERDSKNKFIELTLIKNSPEAGSFKECYETSNVRFPIIFKERNPKVIPSDIVLLGPTDMQENTKSVIQFSWKQHRALLERFKGTKAKLASLPTYPLPSASNLYCGLDFLEWKQEWYNANLANAAQNGKIPISMDNESETIPLSFADLFKIIEDVAITIEIFHKDGYIHRDIKPRNILLKGKEGYLSDFDLTIPCGTKFKDFLEEKFGYWDICTCIGMPTPFADIYGLAMSLLIFVPSIGNYFTTIHVKNSNQPNINDRIEFMNEILNNQEGRERYVSMAINLHVYKYREDFLELCNPESEEYGAYHSFFEGIVQDPSPEEVKKDINFFKTLERNVENRCLLLNKLMVEIEAIEEIFNIVYEAIMTNLALYKHLNSPEFLAKLHKKQFADKERIIREAYNSYPFITEFTSRIQRLSQKVQAVN